LGRRTQHDGATRIQRVFTARESTGSRVDETLQAAFRRERNGMSRLVSFSPHAATARRALAAALVLAAAIAAAPAAASASTRPWQSYVLGPVTAQVTPVGAEGRGQVSHPEVLIRGHGKQATARPPRDRRRLRPAERSRRHLHDQRPASLILGGFRSTNEECCT
jgi:hypothetical protein